MRLFILSFHRRHHVNFISLDWTLSIAIKNFLHFCYLTSLRLSGKSINFDDKKINKSNFYNNKKLISLNDIDVNKLVVSKKDSYGTKNTLKYFIGHNDSDDIRPLCIILPQMIDYVKHFDSNKVSDNKLLQKYKKIWEMIGNDPQSIKYRI